MRNPVVVVSHILARFNQNSLEWISKLNILDSTGEIFFWIPGSGLSHIKSSDQERANHSLFYILRSGLLFVTSAHDNFDNTGGKLTHPDSDVCINIEPGTFPEGKQQLFFHVIYNDKDVIQDIPETNDRTLISPLIKCEPDDINPQKAVEIVLPHCLYVDEVNKGSIEVYRCGQFTNEGSLSCRIRSH